MVDQNRKTDIQDPADVRDLGANIATRETVFTYLTNPAGSGLTSEHADRLLTDHQAVLEKGMNLQSHCYFVANEIIDADAAREQAAGVATS